MAKKRIGILTSGGDCAGLNAAIRAVVHRADLLGWETVGILDGTAGLMESPPQYRILSPNEFDGNIMRLGGTILGTTNKGNPFAFPMPDGSRKDRSDEIVQGFHSLNLDGVIGIGGDGSFAILKKLAEQGKINMVGIPKTIDNDIGMTETSVGFDTAVTVATEALDRLQPTAASHDRVMVLEVMGRDAGHIALAAGIAGGADIILIPEVNYSVEKIAEKIKNVKKSGRNFALMVVSEAVKTPDGEKFQVTYHGGEKRYGGIGDYLSREVASATGFETRVTVLGHVQRGSSPTYNDRLLASAFGVKAVDLIKEGKFGRMVAWQNRQVVDVAIEDAIAAYQQVDLNGTLVQTARALGISLGD
ncbi:MAG TPA: ATP-dependent 6-phosphofructokinase [Micavibrio sp.]|nr:ATP-dependent 6-phosphofructokinase [Pseudomonadota bacterium]HIF26897.1 ATP-dependent 6-phosphofructokinase [Micavibrio sp.]HIL28936.1 ATP-dependent 6-phosphofructokinase [Micavibrio sp.]